MDISIVIVNWNTKDDLRAALQSCYDHGEPRRIETIVIDNGSSDGSVEMVREEFPQTTLLANSDNRGYTAACNQGMREAVGRYYLMLNSDAQLTAGCLQELVRVMDAYPDIGTAGAQLHYPDGSDQPSAYRFPTLSSRLLPATWVHAAEAISAAPSGGSANIYQVDWVVGACHLVRAEAVAQVGMMDERIFMWYDDADWCLRMAQAGWRRVVAVEAVCVHKARKSAEALPPLRRNLQMSMSEFAYFRLHHGAIKTAALWAARTMYSLAKTIAFGLVWPLMAGRNRRIAEALSFNWGRLRFHLRHIADILWRAPKPYRAEDVK